MRLFTSYEVIKGLTLKARIENHFNHHYEDVAGYPALPLGVFGGVEWKF